MHLLKWVGANNIPWAIFFKLIKLFFGSASLIVITMKLFCISTPTVWFYFSWLHSAIHPIHVYGTADLEGFHAVSLARFQIYISETIPRRIVHNKATVLSKVVLI